MSTTIKRPEGIINSAIIPSAHLPEPETESIENPTPARLSDTESRALIYTDGDYASDWMQILSGMFDDIAEPERTSFSPVSDNTPERVIPQEASQKVATGDSRKDLSEVRVYKVSAEGRYTRVYAGALTDDIIARCQVYADAAKCRVELHGAVSSQIFHPVKSAIENTPPISDTFKRPERVVVIDDDTGEVLWKGVKPAGFDSKLQQCVDENSITLRAVSDDGRYTKYFVPESQQRETLAENAQNRGVSAWRG